MNDSKKNTSVTTPLECTLILGPVSPSREGDFYTKYGSDSFCLGIKAKSSSPSELPLGNSALEKSRKTRSERYSLGRIARGIYAAEGARVGLRYILNYNRSAKCSYIAHSDVDIKKSNRHGKCFFTGVFTCGSVWNCPNCTTKIQERRRVEIAHAMECFYSTGYMQAAMITFTFSHQFGDDLKDMLAKQKKALGYLRAGNAWINFGSVFGYDGLIRSLEVTYGSNGYHPHTHELWFIEKEFDNEKIKKYLFAKFRAKKHHAYRDSLLALSSREIFTTLLLDRWQSCCEKVGLIGKSIDAFRKHAIDVKFEVSDSDYLAKQDDSRHWGADREIAKATSKKGRHKGEHPFVFLAKYEETGEGIWAVRWLEYTKAFHGKSQLYWSPGLKNRVGIAELTDQEVADRKDDDATITYSVNPQEWKRVRNDQASVLTVSEDANDKNEIKAHIETISDNSTYERAAREDEITKNPIKSISKNDSSLIENDARRSSFIKLTNKKFGLNLKPNKLVIDKPRLYFRPKVLSISETMTAMKPRPLQTDYEIEIFKKNGGYIIERKYEDGRFERLFV